MNQHFENGRSKAAREIQKIMNVGLYERTLQTKDRRKEMADKLKRSSISLKNKNGQINMSTFADNLSIDEINDIESLKMGETTYIDDYGDVTRIR